MRSSFLRSAGIYGLANVLSAAVPFVLLPILTRALTPLEYGEVISFYMLVAVCSSVAGLSLHGAVGVRWLNPSKGDPRTYTASAVLLVCASTTLAALLSILFAPLLGVDLAPGVCALAAVVAGANVFQGMRFAIWQGCEKPLPAAMLQVSSASLNLGLSLLAVFVANLGGLGRIYGATLAGVLVSCACIYSMFQERSATRVSVSDSVTLLRFGVPLMPHVLGGALLTNADRFAVSAKLGAGALGIYGTASQLGMVINVLADAAVKAYSPTMYSMLAQNTMRSRLRLVAVMYATLPILLLVALTIWACFMAMGALLLGGQYRDAIALSIWFLLGGAISGVYLNVSALFFFTGRTEWISAATLSASLLALLLATSAVSKFGLAGGGATYLAAQVTLLVVAWTLSLWIAPIPLPWSRPKLALRVLLRHRQALANDRKSARASSEAGEA